jgi:hypothetical protein
LNYRLIDFLDQKFSADVFLQSRLRCSYEAALAWLRFNHAKAFKLGIRLCDRVAVNAKLFGKRPNAGKRFARLDGAGSRRSFDLIDDLKVDGLSRFEIQLNDHIGLLA